MYVHDPVFQVISFFTVYGLPLLVLLGLMLFAAKNLAGFRNIPDAVQPDGLLSVLRDRSAPFGDRHDAAMDLADYDEPEVVDALTKVKEDPSEDADIAEEAAHSLLEIRRRNLAN
ncbi:MAG: hypothetical protein AAGA44_13810 [Pseudomonadota bacterium]